MPQAASKREGFVSEEAEEKVAPIKSTQAPKQIEHEPQEAPLPEGPPSPPEVEAFVTKWPMRIRLLHKQIRNNSNELINEVTFREPSGGDINRYGSPVRMNADGMFDIVDKNMSMLMAALSGINLPFIERMDPRDWNSCAYRLK